MKLIWDSFSLVNTENGKDMTVSISTPGLEMAQEQGQYPLINDQSLDLNQELQVQFKGFQNKEQVVSSTYTIQKDCCHVSVTAGNLQLILN